MARPIEHNIDDIIQSLEKYIELNEEPLVQEFALNYGISRSRLYELAEKNDILSYTIKKAIEKQEVYLLKNASRNLINPTFTMFRLKQPTFGYKDKTEIDQNIGNKDDKPLNINLSNLTIDQIREILKGE